MVADVSGELWELGSTVRGGRGGLTAASGPWPEVHAQGQHLFKECRRKLHA